MRFDSSIKEDFLKYTNGNEQAWSFVELFANRSHLIDDIVDGDKEVSGPEIITAELAWMTELYRNTFYQANQAFLMPITIMACNSWLDSNEWGRSEDEVKQCHSDVIKSQYHEVIFACVYLCGGWVALREFTKKHREYQTDNYYGNVHA